MDMPSPLSVAPNLGLAVQNGDAQKKSETAPQKEARSINLDKEDPPSHYHQPTLSTTGDYKARPSVGSSNSQQSPANSTNFFQHSQTDHGIDRPNFRQHAVMASPKLDAIYQNSKELKSEVAVETEKGEYLILEKPTIMSL